MRACDVKHKTSREEKMGGGGAVVTYRLSNDRNKRFSPSIIVTIIMGIIVHVRRQAINYVVLYIYLVEKEDGEAACSYKIQSSRTNR